MSHRYIANDVVVRTLIWGCGRCKLWIILAQTTVVTVIIPVIVFTLTLVTQRRPSNGTTTSKSLLYISLLFLVIRCELWVTCWCRCHTSGDCMWIRPQSDLWKGSILFGGTSHCPNGLCKILVWDAIRLRSPCHTSLCSLAILVLRIGQLYGDKVAAVQLKYVTRIFFPEASTMSASVVTWRACNVWWNMPSSWLESLVSLNSGKSPMWMLPSLCLGWIQPPLIETSDVATALLWMDVIQVGVMVFGTILCWCYRKCFSRPNSSWEVFIDKRRTNPSHSWESIWLVSNAICCARISIDHLFMPAPPNFAGEYSILRADDDAIDSFARIGLRVMFCNLSMSSVFILWVVHGYEMDGTMQCSKMVAAWCAVILFLRRITLSFLLHYSSSWIWHFGLSNGTRWTPNWRWGWCSCIWWIMLGWVVAVEVNCNENGDGYLFRIL